MAQNILAVRRWHKQLALLTFSILLFTACAADKNIDDYNRQKSANQLAKIASAAGDYHGTIVSGVDGSTLGAFTVSIGADTTTDKDANGTTQRPLLKGWISYDGITKTTIAFQEGDYDWVHKTVKATLSVSMTAGQPAGAAQPSSGGSSASGASSGNGGTQTLELTAAINGNTMTGTLESDDHPETAAHFTLTKDAPKIDGQTLVVGRPSSVVPIDGGVSSSYGLTTDLWPGQPNVIPHAPVDLTIASSTGTPEQQFLATLVPVYYVTVGLRLSVIDPFSATSVEWSKSTNQFTAYLQSNGSSKVIITLACALKPPSPQQKSGGWLCSASSNMTGPIFKNQLFTPKSGMSDAGKKLEPKPDPDQSVGNSDDQGQQDDNGDSDQGDSEE